jgi:pimeloyl-ACP methyl ester carboxylesterase
MKYFNGFSLSGEEALFERYLCDSSYSVAGFSKGAQDALEYAYASTQRIDRLILLSPAFFENQKPSFKRTQLCYFDAGEEAYIKQFLSNVSYPASPNILEDYLKVGTKNELNALLEYVWDKEKIDAVLARGIVIEVFVGAKDKIVNSEEVLDFFNAKKCVCYTLNNTGHVLDIEGKI